MLETQDMRLQKWRKMTEHILCMATGISMMFMENCVKPLQKAQAPTPSLFTLRLIAIPEQTA